MEKRSCKHLMASSPADKKRKRISIIGITVIIAIQLISDSLEIGDVMLFCGHGPQNDLTPVVLVAIFDLTDVVHRFQFYYFNALLCWVVVFWRVLKIKPRSKSVM